MEIRAGEIRDQYYPGGTRTLIFILAVAVALLGFLQPRYFIFTNNREYTVWLWAAFVVIFWLIQIDEAEFKSLDWAVSLVFLGLTLFAAAYIIYYYDDFLTRVGIYYTRDYVVGAIAIGVTLAAGLKEYGKLLFTVAILTLAYGYFGPHLPGILEHGGLELRVISANSVEFGGIFGFVSQVGARWIFIFLIYAGMIKAFGGLEVFLRIGLFMVGIVKSGVAQTALVASMLIGSISGSAPANSALTGSFTIPLMKDHGISKEQSAAIEAVASSGGQILPPVMGVVAFIMADLLQTSYTDIIIMAAIPGVIFYGLVAVSIHLVTLRTLERKGLVMSADDTESDNTLDELSTKSKTRVLIDATPFFLSILALIYLLVAVRLNPAVAAFYSIIAIVLVSFAIDVLEVAVTDASVSGFVTAIWDAVRQSVLGLYQGALTMAPIMIIIAELNVIIHMFQITGFANTVALQIVALGDISLLLFLLVSTGLIILLGMGTPTLAAYLLSVTVVVPALVEYGFPEPVAHFYVLYIAVFSNITPPVAIACAVTANIAEADFLRTTYEALKIGIPAFTVPYLLLFYPELILYSLPLSLVYLATVFVGLVAIAVVLQNWEFRGRLTRRRRGLYLATGALFLIVPYYVF